MANEQYNSHRYQEAIDYCNQTLRLDPRSANAWYSTLSRLPVMVPVLCILWLITTGFYFVARQATGNEAVLFAILTVGGFLVSSLWSGGTFAIWMEEHGEKKREH
jgi:hypothetical protein